MCVQSYTIKNTNLLSFCEFRFGWYIPTWFVEQSWSDYHQIIDHWRAMQTTNITSKLHEGNDLDLIRNYLARTDLKRHNTFCSDPACHKGILFGNKCEKSKKCALLLSSYPGN